MSIEATAEDEQTTMGQPSEEETLEVEKTETGTMGTKPDKANLANDEPQTN